MMQDYEKLYNSLSNRYVSMGYDEGKFFDEFPLNYVKLLEFLYTFPNAQEVDEAIEFGYLEELVPKEILVDIPSLEEKFKFYKTLRDDSPTPTQTGINIDDGIDLGNELNIEDGFELDLGDGFDFTDGGDSTVAESVREPEPVIAPQSQVTNAPVVKSVINETSTASTVELETVNLDVEPTKQEQPTADTSEDKLSGFEEKVKALFVNVQEQYPSQMNSTGKKKLFTKGIIYCTSCTHNIAANNSAYLRFQFKDVYGRFIDGKQFNFAGEKEDCSNFIGKICLIDGGVWDKYQNLDQLIITKIGVVTDTALASYNITTELFIEAESNKVDLKAYSELLLGFIQNIEDEDYKRLLDYVFISKHYIDKYLQVPAGIFYHHTGKGHLLQHAVEVAQCVNGISAVMSYVDVNLSLCITGALLHDIGKVLEMPKDGTTSYTVEGVQCGHIVLGTMMITTFANEIKLPYQKLVNLLSLIGTHHGSKDKGSPVDANSPDAMLLHIADEASAQMNHMWLNTNELKPNTESKFIKGKTYIRIS